MEQRLSHIRNEIVVQENLDKTFCHVLCHVAYDKVLRLHGQIFFAKFSLPNRLYHINMAKEKVPYMLLYHINMAMEKMSFPMAYFALPNVLGKETLPVWKKKHCCVLKRSEENVCFSYTGSYSIVFHSRLTCIHFQFVHILVSIYRYIFTIVFITSTYPSNVCILRNFILRQS